MSASRQTILARLAAAQAGRLANDSPVPPIPALLDGQPGEADAQLEQLTRTFDKQSVTWELADSAVAARLMLVSALKAQGLTRLLAWSPDTLPIGGILEALDGLGVVTITPTLRELPAQKRPQDLAKRTELLTAIDAIEVGLTGADAAIATTGTLFVASGPGRPLLVSQIPRRHVVLLPASRVFCTLERWLAAQRRSDATRTPATSLTALTGVSQSRDIELERSVGIHGPRQRHVIIVQGM